MLSRRLIAVSLLRNKGKVSSTYLNQTFGQSLLFKPTYPQNDTKIFAKPAPKGDPMATPST